MPTCLVVGIRSEDIVSVDIVAPSSGVVCSIPKLQHVISVADIHLQHSQYNSTRNLYFCWSKGRTLSSVDFVVLAFRVVNSQRIEENN